MRLWKSLSCVVLGLSMLNAAHAQPPYPASPIRLMVPFPPGGPVDVVGRLLSEKLTAELGQTVYVENKGGAGGGIGAQTIASADPAGYQLLLGSTATISILPLVSANVRYDPDKDFTPIAVVATGVQIFVVNQKVPVSNLREFVDYARKRNGQATAGTGGSANPFFIGMFENLAGIKFLQVPYKGTGPSLADVAAGHLDFTVADTSAVLPLLKGGQVKALGISSLERNPLAPEIPTIAEQGYPGFEVGGWFGIFAPSGIPQPAFDKLAAALRRVSADADINTRLQQMGLTPTWVVGKPAIERVQKENARFAAVARQMGVKPE